MGPPLREQHQKVRTQTSALRAADDATNENGDVKQTDCGLNTRSQARNWARRKDVAVPKGRDRDETEIEKGRG